jgi:hypothetical protein
MNVSTGVLRLEIEGSWTVHDFGSLLNALTDLYNLRLLLEMMYEDARDLDRIWDEMMHFPPLRHRLRRVRNPLMHPFLLMGAGSWPPTLPTDSEQLLRLAKMAYPDEQLSVRRLRCAKLLRSHLFDCDFKVTCLA